MLWVVVWAVLWLLSQVVIGVLVAAIDGAWWPFGPRYYVVDDRGGDHDGSR